MAENRESIVELAAAYVTDLFRDRLDDRYTYHNTTHTREVAEAAEEIGRASGLDSEEIETVLLAAWFHDCGITRAYKPHEPHSVDIATEFLTAHDAAPERIEAVRRYILATDLHVNPATLSEQVLCDADLLHTGTKRFWEHSTALRDEWGYMIGEHFTDEQWYRKQIKFLTGRRFHTAYAQEQYQEGLERNLEKLHRRLRKLEESADVQEKSSGKKGKGKAKGDRQEKQDEGILGKGDRGVETMFRITSRNHVEFSNMVDSKANIMISINTLVISVVISVLFRKLDTNTYMTIPTFVFLAVCLLTIVYAVLASRPKVTTGVFTREDITSKRANLLFFGNFYRVPVEEFEWGMREMLKDKDYLYDSMIRDFYFLGQVLGKKYQYLRISYNIFMYGFVFSILLYVVMFLVFAENPVDILPLVP